MTVRYNSLRDRAALRALAARGQQLAFADNLPVLRSRDMGQ